MSLARWTGPLCVSGFRFGEPGTPLTMAERFARMTDDELTDALHGRLPAAVDQWRYAGPEDSGRARALLRSLAGVRLSEDVLARYPVMVGVRDALRGLLTDDELEELAA